MSFRPDFAQQAQALADGLASVALASADKWSDPKREEYYDRYIRVFLDRIDAYIHGGENMQGMGIDELLEYVTTRMDEFESLCNE